MAISQEITKEEGRLLRAVVGSKALSWSFHDGTQTQACGIGCTSREACFLILGGVVWIFSCRESFWGIFLFFLLLLLFFYVFLKKKTKKKQSMNSELCTSVNYCRHCNAYMDNTCRVKGKIHSIWIFILIFNINFTSMSY